MLAWAASAAAFTVAVASMLPASACAADSLEHVPSSERIVSSEHVPSSVIASASIGSIGLTASPSRRYRDLVLALGADRVGLAARLGLLEHDPEKWEPVFVKDHAPKKLDFDPIQ